MTALPYGPMTAQVRRFLVQLAALDIDAHDAVIARFEMTSQQRAFALADATLGDVIERSGRTDARDALAGPLMQLVRVHGDAERESGASADHADADSAAMPLDLIAEPALAALLALLVRDLLPPSFFEVLYAPFSGVIPPDPA